MGKKSIQEAIDEMTLALLYLTSFPDGEGSRFDEMAWKNYSFEAIDRLDEKDLIINPRRKSGGSYKYVYMTEKGRQKARDFLGEMGMEDKPVYERFVFRSIKLEETDQLVNMEKACFPPNEACSEAFLRAIVEEAGDRCLAAVDRESGKIAGCLYGLTTNETVFNDTFLADISTHDPTGCNIMILGLEVLEAYRKQGLARELVFNYCRREQERGIRRLVLTCHPNKVKMYRKFGFRDLGDSASKWGGGTWHEMDIHLNW